MSNFIEKLDSAIGKDKIRKAELVARTRGMVEFIIFQIIAKKLNKKSKQAIICSNLSKFYYFDKRRKGKKFLKELNVFRGNVIYCEINNDNSFNSKIFIGNPRQPSFGKVFIDEVHGVQGDL